MIKIRGHHLLCMRGFQGLGYSETFVQKMTDVIDMFFNQPEKEVEIAAESDEICIACPHDCNNVCSKHDDSDEEVKKQDHKVLDVLGVSPGTRKTIKELNTLVDEKINSFPVIKEICRECEWREDCLYYVSLRDTGGIDKRIN